ncbi:hypothetical protein J2793_007493 [Paraburkholderia caledonica]|uniref:DUF7011 domain-containing protein n=1 Tax=Paraburkholderia caledonica TaxID=134536 RepID=A0AB73IPS6_9BURK|nr:hypothetical protein [Paraburkholderia caledonica]
MTDRSAEHGYPTAAYLYVLHLDGPALAWEYLRLLGDPALNARDAYPLWFPYHDAVVQFYPDADSPPDAYAFEFWRVPGTRPHGVLRGGKADAPVAARDHQDLVGQSPTGQPAVARQAPALHRARWRGPGWRTWPGLRAADRRNRPQSFKERCADDRHHFRFIVFSEDGAELDDLRTYTRHLMNRVEADLGTRWNGWR